MPLFVFDAGYDSAQLSLDLVEARVPVLVRLPADRCFYADPPPAARSPKGGRPRRHGAKFALGPGATAPTGHQPGGGRFSLEQTADGYQALQAGPPGKILIIPDHGAGLS